MNRRQARRARTVAQQTLAYRAWSTEPGLAAIPGRRRVQVHTDSAYVMNCFRDRWYEKWEANGWVGAGKKPVTNRDLWERLIAQTRRHDVHWVKVLVDPKSRDVFAFQPQIVPANRVAVPAP